MAIVFNALTILIGIGTIVANLFIATRTIRANKEIARENVGKNRTVYETEQITVNPDSKNPFKLLNDKLSTGNYTILTVIQDLGNTSQRLFILGKIKQ